LTVEQIERFYGIGDPDLKISPDTTIEMILNGIAPLDFESVPGTLNDYRISINWDDCEMETRLPNATLIVTKKDKSLTIKSIQIDFLNRPVVHYDKENNNFNEGLWWMNSLLLIMGEVRCHLGIGHIGCGQYAMAVFRHLSKNPVLKLLAPHLQGLEAINNRGYDLIFGPTGALKIPGFTTQGVLQALANQLKDFSFETFKPQTAMTEGHHFAKAQQLIVKLLNKAVDSFFEENEEGIQTYWNEIYWMSKTLKEHSPNEDFPTITTSQEKPKRGDLTKLKNMCVHTMFLVFWHWAVHESQRKWATKLDFASPSPQNGVEGIEKAKLTQWDGTIWALLRFDAPTLVDNPNGNIYPKLLELFRDPEIQQEFLDLGYDITELPYGILI
jgi:hypothetical protein